MTLDISEWPTVAEAARRLGLSERHARRLVDRLPDSDRQKSGTSPLRVRLAALDSLWEREREESARQTPAPESDSEASLSDAIAHARLEERLIAAEAMIVELREDKQRLMDVLAREQQNHLRLLEQIADQQRDARLLHARPIAALPSLPPESDSLDSAATSALDDSGPLPHPLPPLRRPESAPAADPPPANWWQRMMRWVSD